MSTSNVSTSNVSTSNVSTSNVVSDNSTEDNVENNKKSVKQSIIDLNNQDYLIENDEETNIYDNYNIDLSLFNQLEEEEEEEEEEDQNLINEEDETIDEETYFQIDNKVSKKKNTYFDYNKQLQVIDNLKYRKPLNYYILDNEVGFPQLNEEENNEYIINEELNNFDEESAFYNNNILNKKVSKKEIIDEELEYDSKKILDEKSKIMDEELNSMNDEDLNLINEGELKLLKNEKSKKEFQFSDLENDYEEIEEEVSIEDDDNTIGFTYLKLWYIFVLFVFIFVIYKLFIKRNLYK